MSNAGHLTPSPISLVEDAASPCADAALDLMVRALDILDGQDVPGDIGCHLDHAIQRLREWLDLPTP